MVACNLKVDSWSRNWMDWCRMTAAKLPPQLNSFTSRILFAESSSLGNGLLSGMSMTQGVFAYF